MTKKTEKTKAGCCEIKQHPDHQKLLPNVNRIAGQIEGVKRMISEKRYCPDILVQLRAIRSAVNTLEASILEAHLGACIKNAFHSNDEKQINDKMLELKELYKRFNE